MPLDTQQVEKMAHLAHIELTVDEQQKFTKDLGHILDYFAKLKKLDTSNIEPASQSIKLENISRLDEVKDCPEDIQEKIINNFPDKSNRLIKVDKML